jgi:hypothetical protein
MPVYDVQGPNGRIYKVEGPANASDAQLIAAARYQYLSESETPKEDTSGLAAAASAGFSRLKGEGALTLGKMGLMGLPEAEKYYKEQEAAAAQRFTPTQDDWSTSPWLKFRETLGGSLPYIAAPLAAGFAATTLPVSGALSAAALGALGAGAVSTGHFTGSNLAAQMETGKTLEEADLGKAALTAVPQAALDTAAMFLAPGLGKLLGAAGREVTEASAKALANQTLKQVALDYTKATGKAMTVEGLTESAQQLLERAQAGLDISDPAARKEYLESLQGGAALALVLGPFGRMADRSSIKAQGKKLEEKRLGEERAVVEAKQAEERTAAQAAQAEADAAEAERKQQPEYLRELNTQYQALEREKQTLPKIEKPKKTKDASAEQELAYEDALKTYEAAVAAKKDFIERYKPVKQEYKERFNDIQALQVADQTQEALQGGAGPMAQPMLPGFELGAAQPGAAEQLAAEQERALYGAEAKQESAKQAFGEALAPAYGAEAAEAPPALTPAQQRGALVQQQATLAETQKQLQARIADVNTAPQERAVLGRQVAQVTTALNEITAQLPTLATLQKQESTLTTQLAKATKAKAIPQAQAISARLQSVQQQIAAFSPAPAMEGQGTLDLRPPKAPVAEKPLPKPRTERGGQTVLPGFKPQGVQAAAAPTTEMATAEQERGLYGAESKQESAKQAFAEQVRPEFGAEAAPVAPATAADLTDDIRRLELLAARQYEKVAAATPDQFRAEKKKSDDIRARIQALEKQRESAPRAPQPTTEADLEAREANIRKLEEGIAKAEKDFYVLKDEKGDFDAATTALNRRDRLQQKLEAARAEPVPQVQTGLEAQPSLLAAAEEKLATEVGTKREAAVAQRRAEVAAEAKAKADVAALAEKAGTPEPVSERRVERQQEVAQARQKEKNAAALERKEQAAQERQKRHQRRVEQQNAKRNKTAQPSEAAAVQERKRKAAEAKQAADERKAEAQRLVEEKRAQAVKARAEAAAKAKADAAAAKEKADADVAAAKKRADEERAAQATKEAQEKAAAELRAKQAEAAEAAAKLKEKAAAEKAAAEKAAAEKAAAEKEATAPKGVFGEDAEHADWVKPYENNARRIVYSDSKMALLRGTSERTGQYVYAPVDADGAYGYDVDTVLNNKNLTAAKRETLTRLSKIKAQIVAEENARSAKTPDGPFTNAKSNVVATSGIDPKYSGYLQNLMKSLGMGDIRVFLFHPKDVKGPAAKEKYNLFGIFGSAQSAGIQETENGSMRVYGKDLKDFYISIKPGMSEEQVIETLAHELGHIIEVVAYKKASPETQAEIKAEFESWLKENRGKSSLKFIQALRNRETAVSTTGVSETLPAEQMADFNRYWSSFTEWFADNTSKWATTEAKPVSVVEKFFKAIADKLRALVAEVTGRDYVPARSVAKFLNAMGPANPVVWEGFPTAAKSSGMSSDVAAARKVVDRMAAANPDVFADENLQSAGNEQQDADLRDDNEFYAERSSASRDSVAISSALRGVFAGTKAVPSQNVAQGTVDTVNALVGRTGGDKITASAMGLRMRTRIADSWAPIEALLKLGVSKGKVAAAQALQLRLLMRVSDDTSRLTQLSLTTGPAKIKRNADGVKTIQGQADGPSAKKIAKALKGSKLGNAHFVEDLFTTWLAILRAERDGIGYEKLNYGKDKEGNLRLDAEKAKGVKATVESDPDTKKAFEEARAIYRQYNRELLQMYVDSGMMAQSKADALIAGDYVPYYRIDKGLVQLFVGGSKPVTIGSIIDQPQLKELVGGEDKILPIFSGMVQNTSLLVRSAVRNMQTKDVGNLLQDLGMAKIIQGEGPRDVFTARFNDKGVQHYVRLDEEAFPEGIPADVVIMGMQGIKTAIPTGVRMMGIPANLLRKGITRLPTYAYRQLIRDPIHAYMTTGGDFSAVIDTYREFAKSLKGDTPAGLSLKQAGAISSDIYAGSQEDVANMLRDVTAGKSGWGFNGVMAKLDTLGLKADAATRAALYNNFRKKGMSHLEAVLGAAESMNFSRRGTSASLHWLSTMIPFFNSQIQGLDAVYRAAVTGDTTFQEKLDARAKLWKRGALMFGMTFAYAAMMQEDEAYKTATPLERAQSWFLRIPGIDEPLRIPIPFEPGLMFKVIPEMIFNTAAGDTKARDAMDAFGKMLAMSQPIGLPAGVKPLIELASNYNFYTDAPIISQREAGLTTDQQFRTNTTELAKLLGKTGLVSPVSVDHLIRGYTGGLGILLASMANYPLRPLVSPNATDKPAKALSEMPAIGSLFQPATGRGMIDAAFKDVEEFRKAAGTYQDLLKSGNRADAAAFADKHAREIALNSTGGAFRQQMGELAALRRQIETAPGLSSEQKQAQLKSVKEMQIQLATMIRKMSSAP